MVSGFVFYLDLLWPIHRSLCYKELPGENEMLKAQMHRAKMQSLTLAGWQAWLTAWNPALVLIQSMAPSGVVQSQLHWFTMSTSLIHHVLHVGQTIHAGSFRPVTLTGMALAVGGLPSVSLTMTHLSLTRKRHSMRARELLCRSCCQKKAGMCICFQQSVYCILDWWCKHEMDFLQFYYFPRNDAIRGFWFSAFRAF